MFSLLLGIFKIRKDGFGVVFFFFFPRSVLAEVLFLNKKAQLSPGLCKFDMVQVGGRGFWMCTEMTKS